MKKKTPKYMEFLINGKNIALVSKAGTPLINDPGYFLVQNAYKNKIRVVPLPGACAAITALSVSGFNINKFCYEGFLSHKNKKRKKQINNLKNEKRTIILYESPQRLQKTIQYINSEMGSKRILTIAKELTKVWEKIYTGTAKQVLQIIQEKPKYSKGEIVIIIDGNKEKNNSLITKKIRKTFFILKKVMSTKTAIQIIAKIYRIKKNSMYNIIIQNQIDEVDQTVAVTMNHNDRGKSGLHRAKVPGNSWEE